MIEAIDLVLIDVAMDNGTFIHMDEKLSVAVVNYDHKDPTGLQMTSSNNTMVSRP